MLTTSAARWAPTTSPLVTSSPARSGITCDVPEISSTTYYPHRRKVSLRAVWQAEITLTDLRVPDPSHTGVGTDPGKGDDA